MPKRVAVSAKDPRVQIQLDSIQQCDEVLWCLESWKQGRKVGPASFSNAVSFQKEGAKGEPRIWSPLEPSFHWLKKLEGKSCRVAFLGGIQKQDVPIVSNSQGGLRNLLIKNYNPFLEWKTVPWSKQGFLFLWQQLHQRGPWMSGNCKNLPNFLRIRSDPLSYTINSKNLIQQYRTVMQHHFWRLLTYNWMASRHRFSYLKKKWKLESDLWRVAVAATPAPKSRSSARGQWSLSHLATWWSQQSIINVCESQLANSLEKAHDFWHWWHLQWQIMIDMLTFSETLHPCSCAKERISGNLEFPNALETVTQRCFTGRSMHMFPRWATCHVECPHLSFSPFLTRKQREAWIVIWSTWTLDDLEFLGSLFQVWLKSQQRIFYITASIHGLQSIDEAGSLNAAYLDVVGLSTPSWILLLLFASAICLLQVWSLMSFLFLFWICI